MPDRVLSSAQKAFSRAATPHSSGGLTYPELTLVYTPKHVYRVTEEIRSVRLLVILTDSVWIANFAHNRNKVSLESSIIVIVVSGSRLASPHGQSQNGEQLRAKQYAAPDRECGRDLHDNKLRLSSGKW